MSYIKYKIKTAFLPVAKQLLQIYLPISLSCISLFFSIYIFTEQNNDKDRVLWDANIEYDDSTHTVKNISFSSQKPEIILDKHNIYFPSQYGIETSISSSNSIWNYNDFQQNFEEVINEQIGFETTQENIFDVNPIENSYTFPLIIEFIYNQNSELKRCFCLYSLGFRFINGKYSRFKSLNFRKYYKNLDSDRIKAILDFANQTEGYYSSIFAKSNLIDSSIMSDLKVNSSFIKLLNCNFSKELTLKTKEITFYKNNQKADSTEETYSFTYPCFISDSASVKNIQRVIKKYKSSFNSDVIDKKLEKLQWYFNDENFCFFVNKNANEENYITSIWYKANAYNVFIELCNEIKIELWKLTTPNPM